tara:strand:- start:711 stop:1427 length:717 start_codon:yes stop_codon:yes gene_type:complete
MSESAASKSVDADVAAVPRPNVVLAAEAVVLPVPPFATASAPPPKVGVPTKLTPVVENVALTVPPVVTSSVSVPDLKIPVSVSDEKLIEGAEAEPSEAPDREPAAPVSPRGIVKSKVAAPLEPELVTVALEPAAPVVTVPTAMVAAAPVGPVGPVAPTSPRGIVKSNVAALLEPEFATDALVPGDPVVVDPTAMVAAVPTFPCGPVAPVVPRSPLLLKVNLRLAASANVVPLEKLLST